MTNAINEYTSVNTRMIGYTLPILDCGSWGENKLGNKVALDWLGIKPEDEITLYRGTSTEEVKTLLEEGIIESQSWTSNLEVAKFFAHKFYGDRADRCVVEIVVLGSDILGHILDREEAEIILDVGCGYDACHVK